VTRQGSGPHAGPQAGHDDPRPTRQITLGFGNAEVGAMARTGAGCLLCRQGQTVRLETPAVDWQEDDRLWRARAAEFFDVALEPLGEPAAFADGSREWLCRVTGQLDGAQIECLGQIVLGGDGPPPDWRKTALLREVAAWFDPELGFAVHARRPARADAHEAEALEAVVLRGAPPQPLRVEDPRLSTAYAGDGRQRRAGLELWEAEDSDYALRLAAETIGDGELELPDRSVLRSAFLRWHHGGRVGAGRYDLLLPPRSG
jgi:hypothetical protein